LSIFEIHIPAFRIFVVDFSNFSASGAFDKITFIYSLSQNSRMPHVLEVASPKAHLYLWQLVLSRDDRVPRTGHRKVHNGQMVLFEKSCLPKDVVKLYIYNFFVSSSLFGIFLRHILYQENIPQIYHNNIGVLSREFCGARFKRYF